MSRPTCCMHEGVLMIPGLKIHESTRDEDAEWDDEGVPEHLQPVYVCPVVECTMEVHPDAYDMLVWCRVYLALQGEE